MTLKRRAFTLIELLVVIAIIAILAAILFPVFAQAKRAAKATASLSNTKQIALGVIMYTNDYDDDWPLCEAWNESNAQFCFGANACFSPWSYTTVPYIRSAAMLMDPLAGNNNGWSPPVPLDVWEEYNAQYGYNWTLLNGGGKGGVNVPGVGQTYGTVASTTISRPSDMPMLTIDTLHTDKGYGLFGFAGFFTLDSVEGPYCNYQTTPCSDISSYWGIDNGWAGVGNPASPQTNNAAYIEGANTSGVALRDNLLSLVAFCDGHSKAMSAGALAVGTNWSPELKKSQIVLTDPNTYRWWQY